ncbi:MAG: hypothetical protein KJZ74_09705 [Gemmatimonadales bacterium]|nr:hypothetical protein [Gemmatimonadales bacterium]
MFESLRATLADLLGGRVAPAERRVVIAEMKRALVQAKLGVEDLRDGLEVTRRRLAEERESLATATRRRTLAEGINDAETVGVAAKYEAQHAERVAVLERKLEAQEAECGLAERDYDEMVKQLKQASVGAGSGLSEGSRGPTDTELGLPDDAPLRGELDGLARRQQRAEREAGADAKLEELKRRMGRE